MAYTQFGVGFVDSGRGAMHQPVKAIESFERGMQILE